MFFSIKGNGRQLRARNAGDSSGHPAAQRQGPSIRITPVPHHLSCIQVRIYVSFHSFGQYWLTSWGYKTELPVDNEKLVQSVECYLLCRYNSSL